MSQSYPACPSCRVDYPRRNRRQTRFTDLVVQSDNYTICNDCHRASSRIDRDINRGIITKEIGELEFLAFLVKRSQTRKAVWEMLKDRVVFEYDYKVYHIKTHLPYRKSKAIKDIK